MLTTARVRAAAPQARPYKMTDGLGLFLYVAPTGLRSWRMAFRYGGKAQLVTFGSWPELTLDAARRARDEARLLLRQGDRPIGLRRRGEEAARTGLSFEQVAREWHAQEAATWSPVHAADVIASLELHLFPPLGSMPIRSMRSPDLLAALRLVERRGSIETARRLQQRAFAVLERAVAEGLIDSNPAAAVRRGLSRRPVSSNQPAVTILDEARAAMTAIEQTTGADMTKLASCMLALTAVRSGAVRSMRWPELEVEWDDEAGGADPLWRVPSTNMKLAWAKKGNSRFDHIVPLSCQAIALLRAARAISAGPGLVFPGRDGRAPISENTLSQLYARAGLAGRHTPHGWRATFSTVLNERRPADRAAIDLSLAHTLKDKVEGAYNRSTLLEVRRVLFQDWADLLVGADWRCRRADPR